MRQHTCTLWNGTCTCMVNVIKKTEEKQSIKSALQFHKLNKKTLCIFKSLTFFNGYTQFLTKNLEGTILGQVQAIEAGVGTAEGWMGIWNKCLLKQCSKGKPWLTTWQTCVIHLYYKNIPMDTYYMHMHMHMHAYTGRKDLLLMDSILNFCNAPEPLRALNPSNGILDVPVTNWREITNITWWYMLKWRW